MSLVRAPLYARVSPLRAKLFVGAAVFLVIMLWHTPWILPIKIFVVFLHEISHAFAALATGGVIQEIQIDKIESGICSTSGGNRFLILIAGYLGSSIWGGLLVMLACRTTLDRFLVFLVGLSIAGITLLTVSNSFGLLFGYAFAALAVISAWKLPEIVCEGILVLLGVTSCLYALIDIINDCFDSELVSDATMLSDYTGLPTVFWGAFWLLLTLSITVVVLNISVSSPPSEENSTESEE